MTAASHEVSPADKEAYELFVAARNGDDETMAIMLQRGVITLDCMDKVQNTPLSVAVQKGHTQVVKLLLKAKAATEISDTTGDWTPLHWAASEGASDMVELLLNARADANAKDNVNDTPLKEAVRGGHKQSTRLLLEAKASVFSRSTAGVDTLELAAKLTGQDAPDIRALVGVAAEQEAAALKEQLTLAHEFAEARPLAPIISTDETRRIGSSDLSSSRPAADEKLARNGCTASDTVHSLAQALVRDSRVIIGGLVSRPELNGTKGTVLGWDDSTGRYMVRLDEGHKSIKLKSESVTIDISK